jgi:hypothetical protein
MANPELVRVMDYILNRCDSKSIEAVAAAVVRRRRELEMFGDNLPDPKQMAREVSGQINMGASIEGMRETIRDLAVRMIRQEAPELSEKQIAELTAAWIPGSKSGESAANNIPREMLLEMIDHFVRFSTGQMSEADDRNLRNELGAWPERYWKAFPEVIKLIIKDYLNGEINDKAYRSKIAAALSFGS